MSSDTDRLRELLDEQSVEYRIDDARTVKSTSWEFGEHGNAMFTEYDDGDCAFVTSGNSWTPEQAIAVTLGSTCKECAEGMGAYADSLCDPLKEQLDKLLRCIENDYGVTASWDGLRKVWLMERTVALPADVIATLGSGNPCPWCGRDMDKRSEADKDNEEHAWYRDDSDFIQGLKRMAEHRTTQLAEAHGLIRDMYSYAVNREMELCNACTDADGDFADCSAFDEYDGACGIAKRRFEELYKERIEQMGVEL